MPNPTESSYLSSVSELIDFFNQYVQQHNSFSKEVMTAVIARQFRLSYRKPVYFSEYFAIRFSQASGSSFSNTILGLKKLQAYDQIPVIVCVVRPESIQLLLANSTFLKKLAIAPISYESTKYAVAFKVLIFFESMKVLQIFLRILKNYF